MLAGEEGHERAGGTQGMHGGRGCIREAGCSRGQRGKEGSGSAEDGGRAREISGTGAGGAWMA